MLETQQVLLGLAYFVTFFRWLMFSIYDFLL